MAMSVAVRRCRRVLSVARSMGNCLHALPVALANCIAVPPILAPIVGHSQGLGSSELHPTRRMWDVRGSMDSPTVISRDLRALGPAIDSLQQIEHPATQSGPGHCLITSRRRLH
ncbi:hypothetical protein VTI74DRAFT_3189 [Chaetomium olivicolor]